MKNLTILFSIMLIAIGYNSSAQISTGWTAAISANKLPAAATVPVVAKPTGAERVKFTVEIDASSVDNATTATAFTDLGDAVKIELDTNWVVDVWGLDETLDIVGRYVITSVERAWDNFETGDDAEQYTEATDVFIVKGYFEWAIVTP